jgi:hypothetical protein
VLYNYLGVPPPEAGSGLPIAIVTLYTCSEFTQLHGMPLPQAHRSPDPESPRNDDDGGILTQAT